MALVRPEQIFEVLGGVGVFRRQVILTDSQLQSAVEQGLPKTVLPSMFGKVMEPDEATKYTYRVVPRATYARRKLLSKLEGEKAEQIARIIAMAEYVWSDHEKAKSWLNTPHKELEGQAPLRMSLSSVGARRVEDILNNILYGLPA